MQKTPLNNKQLLMSVAPMMDWTDRHDRYFLRLISPDILLYTEMITAHAVIRGDRNYLLGFDPAEHPIALQLGGHDPVLLAQAAKIGEEFGYEEINLNVGCPSPRVSSGRFGACLMLESNLVADCVAAMCAQVKIPVTVKCRIGVDDHDSYESLYEFVRLVASAGCQTFIVHARKAWLKGLSPKQNREIPPLRYDIVHQIKRDFPNLTIIINGGIKTILDIEAQKDHVDGVMIGREAYSNPYFLSEVQSHYLQDVTIKSRHEIIQAMIPYIVSQLKNGVKLSNISRHILGIFQGQSGASYWRRYISQHAYKNGAGIEVIENALAEMILHVGLI